jgi:hypothetical protein
MMLVSMQVLKIGLQTPAYSIGLARAGGSSSF